MSENTDRPVRPGHQDVERLDSTDPNAWEQNLKPASWDPDVMEGDSEFETEVGELIHVNDNMARLFQIVATNDFLEPEDQDGDAESPSGLFAYFELDTEGFLREFWSYIDASDDVLDTMHIKIKDIYDIEGCKKSLAKGHYLFQLDSDGNASVFEYSSEENLHKAFKDYQAKYFDWFHGYSEQGREVDWDHLAFKLVCPECGEEFDVDTKSGRFTALRHAQITCDQVPDFMRLVMEDEEQGVRIESGE
jgi:hypothetical protein